MLRFGFYSFAFGVIFLIPLRADDPDVALDLPGQIAGVLERVTNLVVSTAPENQIRFNDPPDADRDPARQLQKVFVLGPGLVGRAKERCGVDQVALSIYLFYCFHDGICVRQCAVLFIVEVAFKPWSFLAWFMISSFLWKHTL